MFCLSVEFGIPDIPGVFTIDQAQAEILQTDLAAVGRSQRTTPATV
jgi:hypothetical protein